MNKNVSVRNLGFLEGFLIVVIVVVTVLFEAPCNISRVELEKFIEWPN